MAACASPLEFVVAVVVSEPEKVPEAPEPDAVNVTTSPATPTPLALVTLAVNRVGKAVLIVACWPLPACTVMLAGLSFVRLKLAAVATPATVAVTT